MLGGLVPMAMLSSNRWCQHCVFQLGTVGSSTESEGFRCRFKLFSIHLDSLATSNLVSWRCMCFKALAFGKQPPDNALRRVSGSAWGSFVWKSCGCVNLFMKIVFLVADHSGTERCLVLS